MAVGLLTAIAAWVVATEMAGVRKPVGSTPDHGQAATSFGSVGFTVDVVSFDRTPTRLVLQLAFRNTSTQQQRAAPADFLLQGSRGWDAKPVFAADCPDWGTVDLQPPGSGSQPLRDARGMRAPATWNARLCFPEPPSDSGLTLLWEPDVAFAPLSQPVRIPLR